MASFLPAPSLLTGFVVRVAEKSQESVSIEVPVDEPALVFDGPAVQMMLSSRRRIVSASDIAIEDLGRTIHVCVCVTVLDVIGGLNIVEAIERGAVA